MNSTEDLQHLKYYEEVFMSNEKGKPRKMDLPLLKNDITIILRSQKPVIYC